MSFSVDTLLFDTVFTTVGSATRYLKVYNNSNSDINLENVYLDGENHLLELMLTEKVALCLMIF